MKTYRVLSSLLSYPSETLIAALPELRAALDTERLLPEPVHARIDVLLDELAAAHSLQAQERYVDLFDRVRSLSLNLFEHVHGDSRDRGQAMVDLKSLYASHGFELASVELPDYLPAFLEFLSCLPAAQAREHLADAANLLTGIAARLRARGSSYAAAFDALLALAEHGDALPQVTPADIRAEDDPAALDAAWAEEPAFGGAAGSCAAAGRPATAVVQVHRRAAA